MGLVVDKQRSVQICQEKFDYVCRLVSKTIFFAEKDAAVMRFAWFILCSLIILEYSRGTNILNN